MLYPAELQPHTRYFNTSMLVIQEKFTPSATFRLFIFFGAKKTNQKVNMPVAYLRGPGLILKHEGPQVGPSMGPIAFVF